MTRFNGNLRIRGNVRVAGDVYTPLAEGTIVLWLDPLDTATLTVNGSNKVTGFVNKGTGVTWSEPTLSPDYRATGINGRPCLEFDGVTQIIRSSEAGVIATGINDLPFTSFAVVRPNVVASTSAYFSIAANPANQGRQDWASALNSGIEDIRLHYERIVAPSINSIFSPISPPPPTASMSTSFAQVVTIRSQAPLKRHLWRNTMRAQSTAGSTTSWAATAMTPVQAAIGASATPSFARGWNGVVGELVLFSAALSDAGVDRMQQYLLRKWIF